MKAPHFWRLAEIDARRFITACRPGSIHLTWHRMTLRFTRDEFRRLVKLLEQAAEAGPPVSVREGLVQIEWHQAGRCELRIDVMALRLSPEEFEQLVTASRRAVAHLDEILASGVWDRPDPPEAASQTVDDLFHTPFSDN